MSRHDRFLDLKKHPWLGRSFAKLTGDDVNACLSFIKDNDGLSRPLFEMAVNRMFLDKAKPRSWKYILELLTVCN